MESDILADAGNAKAGDTFLSGTDAPDSSGVDAEMHAPGRQTVSVKAMLDDPGKLRIGMESGPELGWRWIDFVRDY